MVTSQAGRAGPDQPIRTIQPAGRTRHPSTRCTWQTSDRRQTDRRQTASSFNAPWVGHSNLGGKWCKI